MQGTLRIVVDGGTSIDVEDVTRQDADRMLTTLARRKGVARIEHPNGTISAVARQRFIAAEFEPHDDT